MSYVSKSKWLRHCRSRCRLLSASKPPIPSTLASWRQKSPLHKNSGDSLPNQSDSAVPAEPKSNPAAISAAHHRRLHRRGDDAASHSASPVRGESGRHSDHESAPSVQLTALVFVHRHRPHDAARRPEPLRCRAAALPPGRVDCTAEQPGGYTVPHDTASR